MKTVLVITTDARHKALYESGLEGYFLTSGSFGEANAFIYDITESFDEADRLWLEGTDVPVIVVGSDGTVPVSESPKRRVLPRSAGVDEVFKALQDLGVADEELASKA